MDKLVIRATRYTPEILLDPKQHLLEIKGESYPENIAEFYTPVFAWIESYFNQAEKRADNQTVTVNLELIYFNSSSSKILLDLFDLFEAAAGRGLNIVVNWVYEADDEDMLEFGEEFLEDFTSLSFNLVARDI